MANPTVIGGASPTQGMDLSNPNVINMIKAMQLAQYQGQQGEAMEQQGDNSPTGTQFVPQANQYAPARAIKQSMLVPAAGAIEKMTGSYMQQKAMQNQIALAMAMQQARDNQKYGTGSPPPQPSPLAAAIPSGVPSGSGAPPVPPVQSGTPLPPLAGYAQAMGSIPPIAAATPGQKAGFNSIVPGPASEAPIPTPPQEANINVPGASEGGMPLSGQANTQLDSAVGSMGGLGGITREAPTPVNSPLSNGNPSPQPPSAPAMNAPLSTGNPNVPDGMSPEKARSLSYTNPEYLQKLLDAQVQAAEKNAELTPEQKNEQSGVVEKNKQQEDTGATDAADMKILQTMQSNMPQAFKRFQNMRDAAGNASYGLGVNEEGDDLKQQLHNQLADKTSEANAIIKANANQAVLPELGPVLANSGMKGNKFLETIVNSAVGMDLDASPQAKKDVIDSQQQSYIAGLKAVASRLQSRGLPAPSEADIDKMASQYGSQQGAPSATQAKVTQQAIPRVIKYDAQGNRLQ